MENVGGRVTRGVILMILFKLFDRLLGFVSVLILARLLQPADFGLVAMATSIVALLELLNAFGFDIALISQRHVDRTFYDTAWTFNVIAAAGIALLMLALAYPATIFYRDARLLPMISVLAAGTFLQGFENIGVVAFRRELQFQKEFAFLAGKRLMIFAVTVPAAFILRNHWALICGIVAGRTAGMVLSYLVHPFRPRFSLAERGALFGFSKWLMVNNLLAFLRERSAEFTIGRLRGAQSLGLYSIGAELANLPTTELAAPINRAVLPGFASFGEDRAALGRAYLTLVGMTALFVVPAGFGIASIADRLIPVLLGEQWHASILVMQIVAIHGVIIALQSNSYPVMLASNRPDLAAKLSSVSITLLLILLITLTHRYGINGAACAYVIAVLIMAPVSYYLVLRLVGLKTTDLLRCLWRPLVAAVFMAVMVRLTIFDIGAEPFGSRVLGVLIPVACGAVGYLAAMTLLWWLSGSPQGAEQRMLTEFKARLKGLRAMGRR